MWDWLLLEFAYKIHLQRKMSNNLTLMRRRRYFIGTSASFLHCDYTSIEVYLSVQFHSAPVGVVAVASVSCVIHIKDKAFHAADVNVEIDCFSAAIERA